MFPLKPCLQVTNAAKYGEKKGRLTLRASRRAGRLQCEVANRPGPKHAEARALYGETDAAAAIVAGGGVLMSSAWGLGMSSLVTIQGPWGAKVSSHFWSP